MSRIVSVMAKNFKGRSFEYELENRLLILGPNGSGKSAIVQAIQLAIDGYVPGINRTNPVILDTLGGVGPSLYVEVAIEHPSTGVIRLGRHFTREKNTVKEVLMVDRRKVDARAFNFALAASQCPKAVAVDELLSMADQKFMIFLGSKVGGGRLQSASASIEKAKDEVNRIQRQLVETNNFIAKASDNVARLNLPPGSLTDIQAEIKQREKELYEANEALAKFKEEERERQRLEREALEKKKKELDKANEALAKTKLEATPAPSVESRTSIGVTAPVLAPDLSPGQALLSAARKEVQKFDEDDALRAAAGRSIRKIIDAINEVACPTCHGGGALMVAKGELRKWEGR
jgi:energy-coupling factor transporter ATP-binding protein EcfA2